MKRHIIYDNYDIYSDDMQARARKTFELQGVEDITDEMIYRECEA